MATHQKKHIKNNNSNKELVFKSDEYSEEYAEIISARGDARFDIKFVTSGISGIARAKGSIIKGPKKQRLAKGDIVLIQSDGSTNDEKYYIIHKYSPEDVKRLRKSGELAQIKTQSNIGATVAFEGDTIARAQEEVVIDDDFIANL